MLVAPAGSTVGLIISAGPYDLESNAGDGTAENPYQIATAGQLLALADHPEVWSDCFVLTDDIGLFGRLFNRALIAPDEEDGWAEVRFQGTPFTGQFDGAGHTIHHLTIVGSRNDCLGLFGKIGEDARVSNLRLDGVRIIGDERSVCTGSIAGHLEGALVGCHVQGLVRGGEQTGALVGLNEGTLTDCSSDVVVHAPPDYGR